MKEKEKRIAMWEDIIPAVFKAEKELATRWQPILAEGKFKDQAYREKVAHDYIHALAEHIEKAGYE